MTAIEFLAESIYGNKEFSLSEIIAIAKEMEKNQIIDAHIEGFYSPQFGKSRKKEAEQYYNETFKSE